MHPDLKGYWQFFGRIDVGEGLFFHAPVPNDAHARQLRLPRPVQRGGRLPVQGRVRPRRLLGPAHRRRRSSTRSAASSSPATPRTATRPTAASASTTASRTRATSAGSWRPRCKAGAASAARLLQRGAAADLPRNGRRFHRRRASTSKRAFLERYNPERDRAEFEQAWKSFDDASARARRATSRTTRARRWCWARPAACRSAHGEHMIKARAGHHLTPRALSSGRNVFEELGPGFTLLAFGADDAAVAAFEEAAKALGVPLKVVRDTLGRRPRGLRGEADPGASGPVRGVDWRRRARRRARAADAGDGALAVCLSPQE